MPNPQLASTGFFDLVAQAGPVGKFVLLLLLMVSFASWSIIFTKWRSMKLAISENAQFLNSFWNSKSIEDIYAKSDQYGRSPVAAVFRSGVKELKKFSSTELGAGEDPGVDNVSRALARASNSEIATLEKHIGWLATTASASPFVGLFGTVWGIMDSFQKIGATGAANLSVVAPGISEALIATAFGIGAAIPAVVAYNHFSGAIRRQAVDIDCFTQDFLNIIQRSVSGRRKGGTL